MLSRLMTRREQLLLAGVAVAICVGGVALYAHDRAAVSKPPEVQVKPAAKPEPTKLALINDRAAPIPLPAPLGPALEPEKSPEPKPQVTVAIMGAVNTPGLYRLEADARVKDLIDEAKGLTENADVRDINLAAKLIDGTTLAIPARGKAVTEGNRIEVRSGQSAAAMNPPQYTLSGARTVPQAPPPPNTERQEKPGKPNASAAPKVNKSGGGLLDLNTASQQDLEGLPGIGPKLAQRIIEYRTQTPFTSVDDLSNVSGFGEKRTDAIRALVTVR